jgi:CRP-like cAMP-binding protein
MTTVGYGDIIATTPTEQAYMIVCMLIGATVFGHIVGSMASLVENFNAEGQRRKEKIDEVNAYLKDRKLSRELRRKVQMYYEYYLDRKSAFDEEKILSELSGTLRRDIVMFLNRDIMSKIDFFSSIQDENFISYVMTLMKPMFCVPYDFIFKEGQIGHDMYFLVKGKVEVVGGIHTDTPKRYKVMKSGEYFGEIALTMSIKRTASVRALTFANLFVLSKTDLDNMTDSYPILAQRIKSHFVKTVSRMQSGEVQVTRKQLSRAASFMPGASTNLTNGTGGELKCGLPHSPSPSVELENVLEELEKNISPSSIPRQPHVPMNADLPTPDGD